MARFEIPASGWLLFLRAVVTLRAVRRDDAISQLTKYVASSASGALPDQPYVDRLVRIG